MAAGARIRAMFGPLEPLVSNLWRGLFVDIGAWTRLAHGWQPQARRVLELGCGEGYSTARLVRAFPGITIDAIDIGGHIGRLYDGPAEAARFRIAYAEELAAEQPGAFDLIVLTDVLHHVPDDQRVSLLRAIRTLLAPGGVLAFKDWERQWTSPVHWAVHGADRWLTGDKVRYLQRHEARALLAGVFGDGAIRAAASVRPWKNNYAFCIANS